MSVGRPEFGEPGRISVGSVGRFLVLENCVELAVAELTRQVRWSGQEALSRPQVIRAQVARNEGRILGRGVVETGPALPVRRHHQVVRRVVQQLVLERLTLFRVRVDEVRFPFAAERVQVAG